MRFSVSSVLFCALVAGVPVATSAREVVVASAGLRLHLPEPWSVVEYRATTVLVEPTREVLVYITTTEPGVGEDEQVEARVVARFVDAGGVAPAGSSRRLRVAETDYRECEAWGEVAGRQMELRLFLPVDPHNKVAVVAIGETGHLQGKLGDVRAVLEGARRTGQ